MKKTTLLKQILIILFFTILYSVSQAQSVTIAPMSCTERSDWINVKTDSSLTTHAVGDGTTDDTAAIQEALDLASASSSRMTVYFPAGTYKISSTLSWTTGSYGISGRGLIGCGSNTTLEWHGATGGTMFMSTGNSKARYIGLQWDGRDIAERAFLFEPHNSTYGIAEAPIKHFNEAFLNFTGPALNFSNPSNLEWSGQADIWNCLFYNCEYGLRIGSTYYNNYEYIVEASHFEDCDTAIDAGNNNSQMIYDTRFENSSNTDITSRGNLRVRRCISTNSKSFLAMPLHIGGGYKHVVQDCWVDSWTETRTGVYSGTIRLGDKSSNMIFDCKFTNPPNSNPPINIHNYSSDEPHTLLVSNNSCDGFSTQSSMVQTGANGGSAELLVVDVAPATPEVGLTSLLDSPEHVFLDSTPIADGTQILDVTQSPYNAANDFSSDATAAIQQAIDDARSANNDSIVYLPIGTYKISSTLDVEGNNYTIEGGGYWAHLCWDGADNDNVFEVDNPGNITLKDFIIKTTDTTNGTNTLTVTADSPGKLNLDGIWHRKYNTTPSEILRLGDSGGVVLDTLPSGATVYITELHDHLTVQDSGPATIFGNRVPVSRLIILGDTQPKTGFLGFLYANSGVLWLEEDDTGLYDISILDNQDLVISDYYNEQTFNNLYMEDGDVTWTGRVTLQGFKRDAWGDNTAVYVNDYEGRLFYGPQSFDNDRKSAASRITHTGTNPFDLILALDRFNVAAPIINLGSGANLIQVLNTLNASGTYSLIADTPSTLTSPDYEAIASGLDHLRELGLHDLALLRGLVPSVTYEWRDTFDQVTGTGSDSISLIGGAGVYGSSLLEPTGGDTDYVLYYKGNTAYDVSLTATPSAVGSKSGLVFSNDAGTSINTNFGGITSSEIDIASIMGWSPGSITKEQVGALVLLFDYRNSGFPSNWMSVGLSASDGSSNKTIKDSFAPSSSPVTAAYYASLESDTDLQDLADILNANNGLLKVTVLLPSGYTSTGASLAIADLWLSLSLSWTENFLNVTGSGSDTLTLSGSSGQYLTSTLQPTGAFADYKLYYKGNTAYDITITAQQNAIGSEPGLVLSNTTGASINTNFGGITTDDINIAAQMGWTPGSITTQQVSSLVLTFDYTCTGFTNSLSVGLSATSGSSTESLRDYFTASGTPVSATFAMSGKSATQIQNFTDYLNANGGFLKMVALVPSGNASTGATFSLTNLQIQ